MRTERMGMFLDQAPEEQLMFSMARDICPEQYEGVIASYALWTQ